MVFGDRDDVVISASLFQGQPAEGELNDAPPPNRFSAVIEKIERLYMVFNIHLVFWSLNTRYCVPLSS